MVGTQKSHEKDTSIFKNFFMAFLSTYH